MPKKRIKKNTIGYSRSEENILFKSGICTRTFTKSLSEYDLNFSYHDHINIHSSLEKNNAKINSFNDNLTISYIEKNVMPTIGIDKSYFDLRQNNIIHSPNTFEYNNIGSDLITANTNKKIYDNILISNYLKTESILFHDDKEKNNSKSHNEIKLNFNINHAIKLSFSLKENETNYREITNNNGDTVYDFLTFNGNTIILGNTRNSYKYDYVGNIRAPYFFNNNYVFNPDVYESPICFNSLTIRDPAEDALLTGDDYVSPQFEIPFDCIPIEDFGFPYSERFKGQDRHLIEMKNYIEKPFVVEKIKLRTNISCYAVSEDDYVPCLNYLNFYIINQKGNLDYTKSSPELKRFYQNSLETSYNLNFDFEDEFGKVRGLSNSIAYNNHTKNFLVYPTYSYYDRPRSPFAINSAAFTWIESEPFENARNIPIQQREIISVITIANYSDSVAQSFDKTKIFNNVDLLIDQSSEQKINDSYSSECIYQNKEINIISDIKQYFENKDLPCFTEINVYPQKNNSNRTNTFARSESSMTGENSNNTSNVVYSNTDYKGFPIEIKEKIYKKSEYVLQPNDTIYVGISLSTQFKIEEDSNLTGRDVIEINADDNKPIVIEMIGYYLEDKNKKRINLSSVTQYKNIKKVGYQNSIVSDKTGTSGIQLYKGSYFTNIKTAIPNSPASIEDYYDYYQSSTFGGFLTLPNNNIDQLDFDEYYSENEVEKSVKYYYNINSFGMPKDKFNKHTYHMYKTKINSFLLSNNFNVNKKFKKGLFIEKSPGTIQGSIKLDFSNIYNFTGQNILEERIFLKSETIFWDYNGTGVLTEVKSFKFSITDYFGKKVNFIMQYVEQEAIHDKLFYSQGFNQGVFKIGQYYENSETNYYISLEPSFSDDFNNANYNTSLSVPVYGKNIKKSIQQLVDQIISSINIEALGLQVVASYDNVDNLKDINTIKIEMKEKGSLGKGKIELEHINSNIYFEDFSLLEGDEINSYNKDKNAYYPSESILFNDNA